MKKIVNVKKFVVSSTILLLTVLMIVSCIVNITYSCNNINYKTIYVTQGDTLWKIAESEQKNNAYYEDKDIRDIVYDLKNTNNLKMSNLSVGQELKIPIK
ncbi:MAG: LysM peptidoglycan-binding domain-containing protein [Clostridia bacterium]|nr:LysM peptidoglycan-binding domain-containing protein [Clostridia bacterium]